MSKARAALALLTLLAVAATRRAGAQADDAERRQRDTLRYGTDTEITGLIQTIKGENLTYLDDGLAELAAATDTPALLQALFGLAAEREGADKVSAAVGKRAVAIAAEYQDEGAATVLAAIDYLGRRGDAAALAPLRSILDAGPARFAQPCLRALGRLSGRAGDDKRDETAGLLVDWYENKSPGDEDRVVLVQALGDAGSPAVLDFLAGLATDEGGRAALRQVAVEALGKVAAAGGLSEAERTKALSAVRQALAAGEPNVRAQAIQALGAFDGPDADAAIIGAFRDSYYKTRQAAAAAAGQRKLAEAVPYLRYRAENDEVPAVKEAAVRALGEVGNQEATAALKALFEDGKTPDGLKAQAAGQLLALDPGCAPEVVKRALELRGKRAQAGLYNGLLRALEPVKSPALETLAGTLLTGTEASDKLVALSIIKNNRFGGFTEELGRLAGDKNASISRRARDAMEALGGRAD